MLTLRLDMAAATVIYVTGAGVLPGTQRIDGAGIRIPDRREHVVLAGDHLPARATRVVMRLRTRPGGSAFDWPTFLAPFRESAVEHHRALVAEHAKHPPHVRVIHTSSQPVSTRYSG